MKKTREQGSRSVDHYTPPSYRGALTMLVISLIAIVLVWLAYSWALNQPNAPQPPDGPTSAIELVIG